MPEIVIRIKEVHKVGEEVRSDVVLVEEMVIELKVMCNCEGKFIVWTIKLNLMLFKEKIKWRHLMQ